MIKSYFDGTAITQDVQFIGHSMGGKISLITAEALDNTGIFDVKQVTLLDPYNCEDEINNKQHDGFYIDHYASFISRLIDDVNLGNYMLDNCFVTGANESVYLADVELASAFDITRCHHEEVNYYLTTIKYPSHYGNVGYYWSITNPDDNTLGASSGPYYKFGYMYSRALEDTVYSDYCNKAVSDYWRDVGNIL
jgi:hypothetical protein